MGGTVLTSLSPSLPSVVAPTLITQPTSDLLVFEDETVSLPCTASGSPPPQFSWVRGGGTPVDLQDSTSDSMLCVCTVNTLYYRTELIFPGSLISRIFREF